MNSQAIAATDSAESPRFFAPYDWYFLTAAGASFVASVSLWFLVNTDYGMYVGIWVPSILSLWAGTRSVMADHASR